MMPVGLMSGNKIRMFPSRDQATDSRQPESANRTRPGSSRQATRPAPTDAKSRDRSQQAGSPILPAGGSTAATADDRPTR